MEFSLGQYEFKNFAEHNWQKVSEKIVMEELVDNFHPVTPILSTLLKGEEITTSKGIYRKINNSY